MSVRTTELIRSSASVMWEIQQATQKTTHSLSAEWSRVEGKTSHHQYSTAPVEQESVVTVAPEQLIYAAQRMLQEALRAIEAGDRRKANACVDIAFRNAWRALDENGKAAIR